MPSNRYVESYSIPSEEEGCKSPERLTMDQAVQEANYAIGAASASAGAATLNKRVGKITSESLSTAAGAAYTLTLTNSEIVAGDIVLASMAYGTNSTGTPAITRVTAGSGQVVIIVHNFHASVALNGTLVISYFVVKAA